MPGVEMHLTRGVQIMCAITAVLALVSLIFYASPAPSAAQGVPAPGSLVITEIHVNPGAVSDANGEWFEIQNVSGAAIDIAGWEITSDGGVQSEILSNASPLIIAPGGFFVIGRNANSAANGGVTVNYDLQSALALSNGADSVGISAPIDANPANNVVIDNVTWDSSWPWSSAVTMSLTAGASAADNDTVTFWCAATAAWAGGAGDFGSPGASNPVCPLAPTPTPTPTIEPTATPITPTSTPEPTATPITPTPTPEPTATPITPTSTPEPTAVVLTPTPIPPTATATPEPTPTPLRASQQVAAVRLTAEPTATATAVPTIVLAAPASSAPSALSNSAAARPLAVTGTDVDSNAASAFAAIGVGCLALAAARIRRSRV